jgi:uncharacterized protein (TIGR03067 family)
MRGFFALPKGSSMAARSFVCSLVVVLPALAASGAADKKEEKLEGTWVVVSGEEGGKKVPDEDVKGGLLTFAGGKMTGSIGKKVRNVFKYKVDEKKSPREVDFEGLEGSDKGKKQPGIYRFEGRQLQLCVSAGGKGRPTEFKTRKGVDWVLLVLERKK